MFDETLSDILAVAALSATTIALMWLPGWVMLG